MPFLERRQANFEGSSYSRAPLGHGAFRRAEGGRVRRFAEARARLSGRCVRLVKAASRRGWHPPYLTFRTSRCCQDITLPVSRGEGRRNDASRLLGKEQAKLGGTILGGARWKKRGSWRGKVGVKSRLLVLTVSSPRNFT